MEAPGRAPKQWGRPKAKATGLLEPSDWGGADWIGGSEKAAVLMRKKLTLEGAVTRARILVVQYDTICPAHRRSVLAHEYLHVHQMSLLRELAVGPAVGADGAAGELGESSRPRSAAARPSARTLAFQ